MSAPDLLVTGRIATLAGASGFGWVEAVAIADGRVVAVGTRPDVEPLAGGRTRRLDLAPDEVAVPGLTDSHLHLADTALASRRIRLGGVPTLAAALERVAAAAGRSGGTGWLEGEGWDADQWGAWPTAAALERVAPGRLVALWAHDHHALWVSEAALAATGVTSDTPDPPGGSIARDEAGRPTGILHESAAARFVVPLLPDEDLDEVADAIATLVPELVRTGIVAVHDPGSLLVDPSFERAIAPHRRVAERGLLRIRVHACVRAEQLESALEAGFRSGEPLTPAPAGPDGPLLAGWLKTFADGTLGSRTAALLEPLEAAGDEPAGAGPPPNEGLGTWMTEPDELRRLASRAAEGGITTTIHAIGDAAVRAALDVLGPTVGRTALVPRLEHVQLAAADDLPRFARLGIAASVQPIHLRSDAAKARRLWGARAEARGYAYGSLARAGGLLCLGTDAPVEPIEPWPGLAIAVTRAAPDWPEGTPAFGPAEAIPLDRALRAQCVDPALSAAEHDRGRLVPGHRADLVVLPGAALEEPLGDGRALASARPRLVLISGSVAYQA